jgi:hypothetical protein
MKPASSPTLLRGRWVASQLGWQRRHQGFLGATSVLLDPFAGFKVPKSSVTLAQHYALKSQIATARRINETAARLSRINGH